MRLTFLNPAGTIGGAERMLLASMRVLRERWPQAELRLVQLSDGPLRAEARALGVLVDVLPLPDQLAAIGDTPLQGAGSARALARLVRSLTLPEVNAAGFIRRLRHALRQATPDLIHSNGLKTHALAALARPRRVPVVWHLHDFCSQRPLMARALNLLRSGVRAGIAISDAVMRDAETVLPGLPLTVIHNAIDTDRFAPGSGNGAYLDQLSGLPHAGPGTVRVGLVATYAHWKGQQVFLNALPRLPANVRGYIIGGPIYATTGSQFTRAELEQHAAANGLAGRIGFVPFQAEPIAAYQSLDVVVHASTRPEPFGLTIVEGMSCAKPVVVSAAGGANELFTDGVDAIAHPPGDTAALAAAIARLAHDPALRARIGAAARNRAVTQFNLARYGCELLRVFQSVNHK